MSIQIIQGPFRSGGPSVAKEIKYFKVLYAFGRKRLEEIMRIECRDRFGYAFSESDEKEFQHSKDLLGVQHEVQILKQERNFLVY